MLRRLTVALSLIVLVYGAALGASAKRIVVVKVDGLPHDMIERFVRERDPRTGKSVLPWIEHLFYERGTRVENFYVRGMSLSGPSWSLLDTGQHLQIKGNVEFDRFTLHSYDYLNFIPYWLGTAGGVRVDMPGTELLDELRVPLLVDAYPYDERHLTFQLYQRGSRWTTLARGPKNRVTSRSPRELFDEWNTGFDARSIVMEQLERELLEKLSDPRLRYLDFYTTDFDHAAHHNRDRATHLHALQQLDAQLGRIWAAIEKSPTLAAETALVVVSDHGTNTDERVYSQGYNLVKLLGTAAGGGHHVITKRRLLNDYAIKGVYPLVPLITTTTDETFYLKGRSTDYPTALVDFDGNERASIHLRDSDLNTLHILLQELQNKNLPADVRRAATAAFFATLERRRAGWQHIIDGMREELVALRRLIERQQTIVQAQPKKWTKADSDAGRDKASLRFSAQLDSWQTDERKYTEFLRTLANLVALRRENFEPSRIRVEDIIAVGSMGEHNSVYDLQNYVVGLVAGGLRLARDGSLDIEKSFARVNYFDLLGDVAVKNNVQPLISNKPVDFVAVLLPTESVRGALGEEPEAETVIWLYGGRDTQALVLARQDDAGRLLLRYLPVARLVQEASGRVRFDLAAWRKNLPLGIWEDENLSVPDGVTRETWLGGWHTDIDWLRATHRTQYSNAVVGIHEQLARHALPALDPAAPGLADDEHLIRRHRRRQRLLVETDLLIFANNHWNFDVRGFNPGGNHGSFFRVSTHSTLMLTGGEQTGVPRGVVVEEPYDSLSFMPTVLALTGQLNDGRTPLPVLWQQGFRTFPGRIIEEIFDPNRRDSAPFARTPTNRDEP